ncbi:TM2 domain-containing protein [Kurthia sibirica]|uniref:TM2 domain-containing protein n=1 Tax=Kurthia sibirica TaxID=202750 RepID=A0A2U3AQM8_9BACL|nr:TM2 domain-containing protein [Kurthia sibirica]
MGKPLNTRKKFPHLSRFLSEEQLLFYNRRRKRPLRAYFSWLILGFLGLHRFYVDWSWSGLMMLLFCMTGILFIFTPVGKIILFILLIWWIIDAIRLPKMIKMENEQLEKKL